MQSLFKLLICAWRCSLAPASHKFWGQLGQLSSSAKISRWFTFNCNKCEEKFVSKKKFFLQMQKSGATSQVGKTPVGPTTVGMDTRRNEAKLSWLNLTYLFQSPSPARGNIPSPSPAGGQHFFKIPTHFRLVSDWLMSVQLISPNRKSVFIWFHMTAFLLNPLFSILIFPILSWLENLLFYYLISDIWNNNHYSTRQFQ